MEIVRPEAAQPLRRGPAPQLRRPNPHLPASFPVRGAETIPTGGGGTARSRRAQKLLEPKLPVLYSNPAVLSPRFLLLFALRNFAPGKQRKTVPSEVLC